MNKIKKILFLPGLDGTGISARPLQEYLRETANELSLQVHQWIQGSDADWAEYVIALEQFLPDDLSEYLIIAESFSGSLILENLARTAREPAALVLCASFCSSPRPLILKLAKLLPLALLMNLPLPSRISAFFFSGDAKKYPHMPTLWKEIESKANKAAMAKRLRIVGKLPKFEGGLSRSIPCIYLQGKQDKLVLKKSAIELKNLIPQMKIIAINGPHFLLQAQPELCWQAIVEALMIENEKT